MGLLGSKGHRRSDGGMGERSREGTIWRSMRLKKDSSGPVQNYTHVTFYSSPAPALKENDTCPSIAL